MKDQLLISSARLMTGILCLLLVTGTGCNLVNSPGEYFDRAALNTNMLSRFGSEYFRTYVKYIKGGAGTNDFNTCEKYLRNYSIASAERNLKKVQDLYPNEEAAPLINASVALHVYVLESYKTDHLAIARMIDKQESPEVINQAIEALDKKSYAGFAEKYDKVWEIAGVYAKNNGIKIKEMPF
ncbi:hypothetical protein TH53_19435 [Pedobacter lusitanus]|uniref:Contig89, whole genome shotgun sequence n=1 Tax=Pedobacter lusitanus TaxID=1503925 RepID=A0A0D0F220_9SPHI|nr:hypothetical protein [Pedobacter lusitanus]KIO75658.1 hypothetical protein TH53_19435 [Pedobacter lusitanus]